MTTTPPASPSPAPHTPADDTEEIYFDGSPSALASLGHIIGHTVFAIMVIAAPFVVHGWGHSIPGWVYLAAFLIGAMLFIVPWIRIRSYHYRISNYRIDYERGFLWKRIDTLELWHVEDISFYQSPLARLFGIGNIGIVSHDMTNPQITLLGISGGRAVFESLKQRVIAVKRQRGVIKMDPG